mgnify:CR=1 FL=1
MTDNRFQNKKLNPDDHKKEDNAAKTVRNGALIAGVLGLAIKGVPKLVDAAKKLFVKS